MPRLTSTTRATAKDCCSFLKLRRTSDLFARTHITATRTSWKSINCFKIKKDFRHSLIVLSCVQEGCFAGNKYLLINYCCGTERTYIPFNT